MKKPYLLSIVWPLLFNLLVSNGLAQDFAAQWNLPEGAKARLGKGKLINIKLSPDSTRVIASTSIGIWMYDAQTHEVLSLFSETQIGESPLFFAETPLEALTFSPDALIVATAHGNTIYVWDTFTGNAFAMLEEHPGSINALALSPDGAKLAAAGGDWTVRLWEVRTGKYLKSLTGHPSAVNSVAFSPNGQILASAGSTLHLWDANTGELLHADDKDLGSIDLLAFSPDGKTLASGGGWDHTVHLWDVNTGKLRTGLKGHTGSIRDMAFSPDSTTLVTASSDKTMRMWDVKTATEQKKLPTPEDAMNPRVAADRMLKMLEQGVLPRERDDAQSVKFSEDGTQLISLSSDGSLHLWSVDTGRYLQSTALGAHTSWISTLAFSTDSKYLITDNALEARARVWNIETFTQDRLLTPPQNVIGLTFSPDFKKLVGRVFAGGIQAWDAVTKERLFALEGVDPTDHYWPLVFSPDGKILAGRGGQFHSPKIQFWQADTGDQLFICEEHTDAISRYTFSPNSEIFASGGRDGTLILWDTQTGKSLSHLTGHTKSIEALAFSPNSEIFASGGRDGTLILWDTQTGKSLSHLTGHTKSIEALAFSADSKTLASGGGNEIYLWDVPTAALIATLNAGENLTALVFSPNGKMLVSGNGEGRIHVSQPHPDYHVQAIRAGHQGSVSVLMFSPDSKTLASGSHDGTILLWDPEKLKRAD